MQDVRIAVLVCLYKNNDHPFWGGREFTAYQPGSFT